MENYIHNLNDIIKYDVIEGMGLTYNELSPQLLNKIRLNISATIIEMRAAGISDQVILSQLGKTAVSIVCNDLLNIDSGNVKLSQAYLYYIPILQSITPEDLRGILIETWLG